jgi:hypothetical protein
LISVFLKNRGQKLVAKELQKNIDYASPVLAVLNGKTSPLFTPSNQ